MPIYEYRCIDCNNNSTIFFRSFSDVSEPSCSRCNGTNMTRQISRVIHLKGQRQLLHGKDINRMLEGSGGADKKRQADWARRMSQELGSEMGAEYHQMAEQVEAGQEAFDLYDPSAHLEHRMRTAGDEAEGLASQNTGDS